MNCVRRQGETASCVPGKNESYAFSGNRPERRGNSSRVMVSLLRRRHRASTLACRRYRDVIIPQFADVHTPRDALSSIQPSAMAYSLSEERVRLA